MIKRIYAKQNQKKTSPGSFYEERGKLAPSEVTNSDQGTSTTAQPNQTSFLSWKAYLLPYTENHVLFLLWGTLFPVPSGEFLPILRVPVRLWKSLRKSGCDTKKQGYWKTIQKGGPNINNCDLKISTYRLWCRSSVSRVHPDKAVQTPSRPLSSQ